MADEQEMLLDCIIDSEEVIEESDFADGAIGNMLILTNVKIKNIKPNPTNNRSLFFILTSYFSIL